MGAARLCCGAAWLRQPPALELPGLKGAQGGRTRRQQLRSVRISDEVGGVLCRSGRDRRGWRGRGRVAVQEAHAHFLLVDARAPDQALKVTTDTRDFSVAWDTQSSEVTRPCQREAKHGERLVQLASLHIVLSPMAKHLASQRANTVVLIAEFVNMT